MGRKILFITTDQQRFDALGCNGGTANYTGPPRTQTCIANGNTCNPDPLLRNFTPPVS